MDRHDREIAKLLVKAESLVTAGRGARRQDPYLASGSIRRRKRKEVEANQTLAALDKMLSKAESARNVFSEMGASLAQMLPEGDLRSKYQERLYAMLNAAKPHSIKGFIDEVSSDFMATWEANPPLAVRDQKKSGTN